MFTPEVISGLLFTSQASSCLVVRKSSKLAAFPIVKFFRIAFFFQEVYIWCFVCVYISKMVVITSFLIRTSGILSVSSSNFGFPMLGFGQNIRP